MRRSTEIRARGNEGGFTLVELLVAAALAGIGFLGLALLHGTAIRATAFGRNTSVATVLATELLEVMRRGPSDALADVAPTSVVVGPHSYTRRATVGAAPMGNSRQVTVDVDWYDRLGSHQVELVTVIGP